MDQRKEEITRRPLYGKIDYPPLLYSTSLLSITVYDLPSDILTTLTPKTDTNEGAQDQLEPERTDESSKKETRIEDAIGSKSCSLCGVSFYTVEDQRSHVRSDLHGYNLKQRIRGSQPVNEGDFEKLVGGMQSRPGI